MTRALSAEAFAALQRSATDSRDFLWLIARNRDTGASIEEGVWSGDGNITVPVIDPKTGGTQNRFFYGNGAMVSLGDIPLAQGMSIQSVDLTVSQVNDVTNNFFRQYDLKQAEVQIFRGLYDTQTGQLVSPAIPRFAGFIDEAPVTTPKEGDSGGVIITCMSNTQELTRANSDTSSDASQRLRSATDNFFQDVAVVGTWEAPWGQTDGKAQ